MTESLLASQKANCSVATTVSSLLSQYLPQYTPYGHFHSIVSHSVLPTLIIQAGLEKQTCYRGRLRLSSTSEDNIAFDGWPRRPHENDAQSEGRQTIPLSFKYFFGNIGQSASV